jgi:uncharacterized membrane protein
MNEIPLNADVECKDGLCGQTTTLIVDPATLQVTHVVVKEKERPHTQRMISTSHVLEISGGSVRLDITAEELRKMQQFVVTEYRVTEIPRYVGVDTAMPYYSPELQTAPVERELVPEGELAVHVGVAVEATDGKVGELSELVTDQETGRISHLVLEEGHLWGKKQILLPVPMVESVVGGAIQLKVDKQTIASMLAVPAKQAYGVSEANLLVWTYLKPKDAEAGLDTLKDVTKQEPGAVLAGALLTKETDGKASLREMGDVDRRHGALFGALTGGLTGLLGGPVGAIVGAAAGAATGRAVAGRIDLGFPDQFLEELQKKARPGTVLLVALVEGSSVDKVAGAMSTSRGSLTRVAVTDEILAQIAVEGRADG